MCADVRDGVNGPLRRIIRKKKFSTYNCTEIMSNLIFVTNTAFVTKV